MIKYIFPYACCCIGAIYKGDYAYEKNGGETMERAINVARYICEEYRAISGEYIDEMKLHKLLYLSQRESLALSGKPLFKEQFEGWRYGPVCVKVRNSFCQGEMLGTDFEKIDDSSAYIVKNIILQYGPLASWKLSQISHSEYSWKKSREGLRPGENGNVPLKLEDIRKDAEKVRPYDSMWDMYIDEFDDYEEEG